MTGKELSDDWAVAHRELQELRAISRATPRRKLSAAERQKRKRYAAHRWHKTQAAHRRHDSRNEGPANA